MGMTLDDFGRLTPAEFRAAYELWHEKEEAETRDAWELMRMHAAICLQPHTGKGKKLQPRDILLLPWEKNERRPQTAEDLKKLFTQIKNGN